MKLTKTRLRNRLSDINLCRLVRIAVEGPELNEVNFEEIVDIFKEHNRHVNFNNLSPCLSFSFNNFYNRDRKFRGETVARGEIPKHGSL